MTTALSELHIAFKEALSYHEALRRLGFPARDIFVQYVADDGGLVVQIQHAGLQCPNYTAGLDQLQFATQWGEAVKAWNTAAGDEGWQTVWESSVARRESVRLLMSLIDAGVIIPSMMQGNNTRH